MGACCKCDAAKLVLAARSGEKVLVCARHCESGVCNKRDSKNTGTGCMHGIVKVVFATSVMTRKKCLLRARCYKKRTCSLRGVWVALARSGRILVCEVLRFGVYAAASNRKKCDPIVGAKLVGAVCDFWCRIGGRGL